MSEQKSTRRSFLGASAAAAAFTPYIFTGAQATAALHFQAANDRRGIGQIGCGGQGNGDTRSAARFGNVLAVCDADSQRAEEARNDENIGKGKAVAVEDYRKVLDRKDIDVVVIGTPDHWHSKIAIDAMKAGKDVYCEKPLTLTIDEGKQIIKVLKETGRVFQVGTQQRSHGPFRDAVAIARDGRLGKIHRVTVAIGAAPRSEALPVVDPPKHLNWDLWLGQAPQTPYRERRCHYEFRWWYEYSGGKMTDWGAHHVDVAHWVLNAADTGPVSLFGAGSHPVPLEHGNPTRDDMYNVATNFCVVSKFQGGVELIITDTEEGFENGVLIEGDKGRIFVNREKLTGKAVEELKDHPLSEEIKRAVYNGKEHGDHMRNFWECLDSREQPISDVYSHHRAMTTCHLANICIRLGRPIHWDPVQEMIVGDDEAKAMQSRVQRKGYEVVA